MGGYSYNAGLNPEGSDGVQSGNGQVAISLLYGTYTFFFQKDNKYYLPIGKYFNTTKKSFEAINLNEAKFITFKNPYNQVLVNRIAKESLDYIINTLDTF